MFSHVKLQWNLFNIDTKGLKLSVRALGVSVYRRRDGFWSLWDQIHCLYNVNMLLLWRCPNREIRLCFQIEERPQKKNSFFFLKVADTKQR